MMKRVLIYGKSNKAIAELPAILMHYELAGFVVSDMNEAGINFFGKNVFHYTQLGNASFDMVIICSMYLAEISDALRSVGIENFVSSNDLQGIQDLSVEFGKYRDQLKKLEKEKEASKIPLTVLSDVHINCCELLTDRNELLSRLPKNGFAAELGVANGDFTACILANNQPQRLHLVDVWHSERYNDSLMHNVESKFFEQIKHGSVKIHRNFSQDAVSHFEEGYFDWIYIDTTHSYEQTKLELELYSQKLKPGGIIAGHDYMLGNWVDGYRYGVIEAVHEFCLKFGYRYKYLTMDLAEAQSFAIEKIS